MRNYDYLIVGGGMTGDAAVRGIRELDGAGTIGMITSENDPPYARPPLSKGMWKGRPFEKVWRGTERLNVDLNLGKTAVIIHAAGKTVRDEDGDEYSYKKLLIATGGAPNRLPTGDGHIIYYRTLRDYERLRALADDKQRFLVIGAGFIGSEIAAALTMYGRKVTMVFREGSIGASRYPAELSKYISTYYSGKGVQLLPHDSVTDVSEHLDHLIVRTKAGHSYEVDGVVAGIGLQPNLDLARASGLATDNGIVVDDQLRTSAPDIYAAGDVAAFPHSALGRLIRVEHEDNALMMGKQAGRNMAGAAEPYNHVPYFYSDLFELGYEAVGELNSELETVEDWTEPMQKGVIYYLRAGRVRGVLLWNVWDRRDQAASLLSEPGPFNASNLIGRIKP
jgi:NADPH-dependent 2,4-dienoyl-CoA reductase/sulfur reductase-like enzyme